ncbi:MAG: alpha-glucosidase/alpha-galactosidase, partial [Chloroflexi bacterium]|nr:alpha-glucosidase/alpha-galactosidase [Chloroflexota bacterium]
YVQVRWRGLDMVPRLLELFEAHPVYSEEEKVRIDVLRRFGYYSTESNGHLSEYLPWYRKRPAEIGEWISLNRWILGETGGYLRVCNEGRNWFETEFPNWLAEEPPKISAADRSLEHGSYIIEGLETGRVYRGHFNVPNRGYITNLPDGCVVEIPGYVDKNGINMPMVGDLPLVCAATCSASVRVQEMALEAAVHGDVTLLKQAMLHDPLVGAVCNPEEVWQMTDELLVAQAEWLPNYSAEAIEGARARLAAHETNGTRVMLSASTGAARLHTRTVEELAAERR